jgi:hypothetical protein
MEKLDYNSFKDLLNQWHHEYEVDIAQIFHNEQVRMRSSVCCMAPAFSCFHTKALKTSFQRHAKREPPRADIQPLIGWISKMCDVVTDVNLLLTAIKFGVYCSSHMDEQGCEEPLHYLVVTTVMMICLMAPYLIAYSSSVHHFIDNGIFFKQSLCQRLLSWLYVTCFAPVLFIFLESTLVLVTTFGKKEAFCKNLGLDHMTILGYERQSQMSGLLFESIPLSLFQGFVMLGGLSVGKLTQDGALELQAAIAMSIVNACVKFTEQYIEANALEEDFVHYAMMCMTGRLGWVPFIQKFTMPSPNPKAMRTFHYDMSHLECKIPLLTDLLGQTLVVTFQFSSASAQSVIDKVGVLEAKRADELACMPTMVLAQSCQKLSVVEVIQLLQAAHSKIRIDFAGCNWEEIVARSTGQSQLLNSQQKLLTSITKIPSWDKRLPDGQSVLGACLLSERDDREPCYLHAVAKELLKCSADPNVKDDFGQAILLRCTKDFLVQSVQMLIDDPRTDLNCYASGEGEDQETPLCHAIDKNYQHIVDTLLKPRTQFPTKRNLPSFGISPSGHALMNLYRCARYAEQERIALCILENLVGTNTPSSAPTDTPTTTAVLQPSETIHLFKLMLYCSTYDHHEKDYGKGYWDRWQESCRTLCKRSTLCVQGFDGWKIPEKQTHGGKTIFHYAAGDPSFNVLSPRHFARAIKPTFCLNSKNWLSEAGLELERFANTADDTGITALIAALKSLGEASYKLEASKKEKALLDEDAKSHTCLLKWLWSKRIDTANGELEKDTVKTLKDTIDTLTARSMGRRPDDPTQPDADISKEETDAARYCLELLREIVAPQHDVTLPEVLSEQSQAPQDTKESPQLYREEETAGVGVEQAEPVAEPVRVLHEIIEGDQYFCHFAGKKKKKWPHPCQAVVSFLRVALEFVSIADLYTDTIILVQMYQNHYIVFTALTVVMMLSPYLVTYAACMHLVIQTRVFENMDMYGNKKSSQHCEYIRVVAGILYTTPVSILYFIVIDILCLLKAALLDTTVFLLFGLSCGYVDLLSLGSRDVWQVFCTHVLGLSKMDVEGCHRLRTISQLIFESVPQIILQLFILFGPSCTWLCPEDSNTEDGFDHKTKLDISHEAIYASITFAMFHLFVAVLIMAIEAAACRSTLFEYMVLSLSGRMNWVPYIEALKFHSDGCAFDNFRYGDMRACGVSLDYEFSTQTFDKLVGALHRLPITNNPQARPTVSFGSSICFINLLQIHEMYRALHLRVTFVMDDVDWEEIWLNTDVKKLPLEQKEAMMNEFVSYGAAGAVQLLIAKGARPLGLFQGQLLLAGAAKNRFADVIQVLLDSSCKPFPDSSIEDSDSYISLNESCCSLESPTQAAMSTADEHVLEVFSAHPHYRFTEKEQKRIVELAAEVLIEPGNLQHIDSFCSEFNRSNAVLQRAHLLFRCAGSTDEASRLLKNLVLVKAPKYEPAEKWLKQLELQLRERLRVKFQDGTQEEMPRKDLERFCVVRYRCSEKNECGCILPLGSSDKLIDLTKANYGNFVVDTNTLKRVCSVFTTYGCSGLSYGELADMDNHCLYLGLDDGFCEYIKGTSESREKWFAIDSICKMQENIVIANSTSERWHRGTAHSDHIFCRGPDCWPSGSQCATNKSHIQIDSVFSLKLPPTCWRIKELILSGQMRDQDMWGQNEAYLVLRAKTKQRGILCSTLHHARRNHKSSSKTHTYFYANPRKPGEHIKRWSYANYAALGKEPHIKELFEVLSGGDELELFVKCGGGGHAAFAKKTKLTVVYFTTKNNCEKTKPTAVRRRSSKKKKLIVV